MELGGMSGRRGEGEAFRVCDERQQEKLGPRDHAGGLSGIDRQLLDVADVCRRAPRPDTAGCRPASRVVQPLDRSVFAFVSVSKRRGPGACPGRNRGSRSFQRLVFAAPPNWRRTNSAISYTSAAEKATITLRFGNFEIFLGPIYFKVENLGLLQKTTLLSRF